MSFFKSTNFPFEKIIKFKACKSGKKMMQRAWIWLNIYGDQAILKKVILVLKTLKYAFLTPILISCFIPIKIRLKFRGGRDGTQFIQLLPWFTANSYVRTLICYTV